MMHVLALHSATGFPWLLDILLKSAVLLALAGIAVLACWRASAAQRHLIWTLAVIGVLLLPVFSVTLPAWHVVRLPAPLKSMQASVNQPLPQPHAALETPSPAVVPPLPSPAPAVMPPLPEHAAKQKTAPAMPARAVLPLLPWQVWALLLWATGALLVLARWGYGQVAMRRLLRAARSAPVEWSAGLPVGVRLLVSDAVRVPLVGGIIRPCILLPAAAAEWPEARRQAALLHELAHIRRGDLRSQALARLAGALYWPNPLVWLANYRLCIEREAACDDAVLVALPAADYAAHLLAIAGAAGRPAPAGIAMARTSKVGRRIKGVLDARRNRRRARWPLAAVLTLLGLPLLLGLAMAQAPETPVSPLVQRLINSPVPKDIPEPEKAPFFQILAEIARQQEIAPTELTEYRSGEMAMLTEGKAIWISEGTTRYALVVMGAAGTHLAVQKLVLLNSDGKILDTLACSINGRYGTLGTETFHNAQSDGAQIVIRFHPYPGNKSAWHNWHHITHGTQSVMYREDERVQSSAWDTRGLCRLRIQNERFVVTFPTAADVRAVDGNYMLINPSAPADSGDAAVSPANLHQPVAGAPYHGLVVAISTDKPIYKATEPVNITLTIQNTGTETVSFWQGGPLSLDYEVFIYDASRKPVAKSAFAQNNNHTAPRFSTFVINLDPGKVFTGPYTYDLREYVKALPPGTYTLQVMLVAASIKDAPHKYDEGALSLPCQFTIAN